MAHTGCTQDPMLNVNGRLAYAEYRFTVYVYIYMYIYVCVYMYIYIYILIHIYVYIYTHTRNYPKVNKDLCNYLTNKLQFCYFLFLFQRLHLNSSFRRSLIKFKVHLHFKRIFGDLHLNLNLNGKSLGIKRVHCSHWAESGRPNSWLGSLAQLETGERAWATGRRRWWPEPASGGAGRVGDRLYRGSIVR
jgi:hypothetical protein